MRNTEHQENLSSIFPRMTIATCMYKTIRDKRHRSGGTNK